MSRRDEDRLRDVLASAAAIHEDLPPLVAAVERLLEQLGSHET